VRDALDELGDLWSQRRNGTSAVRGDPDGATNTVWQELPRQVADGDAALAFGPSFLAGQAALLPHPEVLDVFPYPRVGGGDPPVVVGGDVAIVPPPAVGRPEPGRSSSSPS
jgi:ABC-type glycerol-3-phosphate transport system substrate-binding protein